ncbi:MAG: head GIN domain-containing protein [Bacteroidota bacterium]
MNINSKIFDMKTTNLALTFCLSFATICFTLLQKPNLLRATIAFVLLAGLASCSKDREWVRGEGSNVSNTRIVTNFNEIALAIDANVELYQDSVFRVELNGQQNVLDVIETSVNGNRLCIDLKRHKHLRRHNTVTVKVYMPTLKNIDISGSGNVSCRNNFNMSNLNANISGSGDIDLKGTINENFSANVSGSGSINFSGESTCNTARYVISGSGDINAEWLKVNTIDATISGSGEITLYAINQLNANISGSGDIRYRGTPTMSVRISGSGKVTGLQ